MITTNGLRAPWRGKNRTKSDRGPRGGGTLIAKTTRDGVRFLFQYFIPGDGGEHKRFLPLGPYDESGVRGLSLPKARDKAAELSALYRSGVTDLHGHFQRQRDSEERARKAAEEAERRAREAAQRSTLRQLLDGYIAHQERLGKQSVKDVRSIFSSHVYEAAPELAAKKAAEITVDEFVQVIGALTEKGKGRTAAKLRAYLRASYSMALRAKTDPSAPMSLRSFGIETNPLASVGALSQFGRARDRTLSGPELAVFLKRIEALEPGAQRDVLLLCLYCGGQRPVQLLRARPADVDLNANTITLLDSKGARRQPRVHVVPLTEKAAAILERRIAELREGEPLFSTDRVTRMRIETPSALVREIAAEMLEKKEAREAFQLRDVRRTVETMLAGLGFGSDVRAQLQSHNLGGIQVRHYDRHSYLPEKKAALQEWDRHLERLKSGKVAKVVGIETAKRGRGAQRRGQRATR
jgi:integrase